MVCVRQGTERSLALSPCAACGICFLPGGSCRGSGDEPPLTATATSSPVPATTSRAASQSGCGQRGLLVGKKGARDQARCLESRANPTGEAAELRSCGSSLLARKPMSWHQTRPRSAPQPWEQWVTGKCFFFFFLATISGGTVIQE